MFLSIFVDSVEGIKMSLIRDKSRTNATPIFEKYEVSGK